MTLCGRMRASIAFVTVLLMPACALQKQDALDGRESAISYEMTLDTGDYDNRQCEARISLDYWQKNTVASVESELTNDQCGPSSGTYVISVRYENDTGDVLTTDYNETWIRQDDMPLETTREYAIGENVDLVNVRVRKLRCECADPLPVAEDRQ